VPECANEEQVAVVALDGADRVAAVAFAGSA
jgi:hypothetical protein